MVVGAFPAAKLGLLAVRQVSKPLANVIKDRAKNSKTFRTYICMPPAQFYNWVEVKTKMWALNLGKPVVVPPLNEAAAIELGANLLGEIVIFSIAAGALLFEYTRQTANEYKKQEAIRLERLELTNTIAEIGFRLERQDAQIREMTRALADLGRPMYYIDIPPSGTNRPIILEPYSADTSPSIAKVSSIIETENEVSELTAISNRKEIEPTMNPNAKPENDSKSKKSRNIFKWTKDRIAEYQPFDPNTPDQSPRTDKKFEGQYDPNDGLIFKGLNYLETHIYGDRHKQEDIIEETDVPVLIETMELQPYIVTIPQEAVTLSAEQIK